MTSYTVNGNDNKESLIVNLPYDTFNIIKNKNGSAHYFFNGFERIKGTDEIIIKLIRANDSFTDYNNVMYDGRRKNIKFSDKYEFINFNEIKEHNIKLEIAEAIKLKDRSAYDDFFHINNTNHGNYKRSNIDAVDGDTFDYDGNTLKIDQHLAGLIKYFKKTPKQATPKVFDGDTISVAGYASSNQGNITIRDTNSFIVDNPNAFTIGNGTTSISNNPIIISRNRKKRNNKIILSPAKLIIL
jgi:hypothetical protein